VTPALLPLLPTIGVVDKTARSRVLSLRLPEGMADEIAAVARTDGVSASEAIREAIANHITTRRADKAFKERLKQRLEEDREVLERLAE
jgi:Arc/MetJ-type ribon-helix-helix transcriptional regulator